METVASLRDPKDGCPWDLEQTHQTLTPYLLEESYEYIYAVENQSPKEQLEELGDVLLQVILNSQVAKDENLYDLTDVCQVINEKLINRHPHVFQKDHPTLSTDQVKDNWKKLKSKEKKEIFPLSLLKNPALYSSFKIGQKAKDIDFDWQHPSQVWKKVEEEFAEVEHAISLESQADIEEELGDLFFSLSQYSRHLGANPEELARNANKKFLNRMSACEELAREMNKNFSDLNHEEKENLWKKVKKNEKMGTIKKP